MQACPYDALYIDPETHTAAKCNYCAHRVDVGLEPACVNVCPEHAIISGDMDDPASEISTLLAREQTTVRKAEKGTSPNLFYIEGDALSLTPTATPTDSNYLSNEQSRGVGHYARYTEQLAYQGEDIMNELLRKSGNVHDVSSSEDFVAQRSIEVITGKSTKRTYDAPDKGLLWGWEVPAYVTTKAISTGAFLVPFLSLLLGLQGFDAPGAFYWPLGISLVFLVLTTAFLVKDLDQPGRFVYVLLRPQWRSWLVRGGYALTLFGGLLTLSAAALFFGWVALAMVAMYATAIAALVTAIYTAYLFAQAKGRDFWQSPTLPVHMLIHALIGGGAVVVLLQIFGLADSGAFGQIILRWAIVANLVLVLFELSTPHPTMDAKMTVQMILHGRYKNQFWGLAIAVGNLLPVLGLFLFQENPTVAAMAALLAVFGVYRMEKIWIEAPQRIALS